MQQLLEPTLGIGVRRIDFELLEQVAGFRKHDPAHRDEVAVEIHRANERFKRVGQGGRAFATAARFFAAIERDDLLADPRFADSESRLAHRDELHEALVPEFRRFTRDEILALAAELRLTIGPVLDVVDALADEHYRARGTIVEMEDGVVLQNVVPRLSGTPGAIRLPAPALGEHNAAVYGELGIDADELARLSEDGVV